MEFPHYKGFDRLPIIACNYIDDGVKVGGKRINPILQFIYRIFFFKFKIFL